MPPNIHVYGAKMSRHLIHLRLQLFFLALLLPLSGCSTLYDNTVGLFVGDSSQPNSSNTTPSDKTLANTSEKFESASPSRVAIESGDDPTASDELEVLWKIPAEPVDAFVLRYGFSREALTEEVVLKVGELEKADDPDFGFVYRHILKNVPPSKRVFVSLASQSGGATTEFSDVFEVEASAGE